MLRPLALSAVLALAASSPAQDGIPPDTLAAVKRATVFIQVQGTGWKASGSGFVAAAHKDSLLIATNHHVVTSPEADRRPRPTPAELARSFKQANASVVFDPGTKGETTAKAELIAADPDTDLAVLRVPRPKDAPAPLDLASAPNPTETMPVYLFGFPFGQTLALAKGAPAVTVGKGSVSSLRLDEAGNLAVVQIDGALNPGNSGGPVVDGRGRLVGVAVSRLRNGQGIGFAIPAADLALMMKGRLGALQPTVLRPASGKVNVRVEVEVVDPAAAVRGVTLHYRAGGEMPARSESLAGKTGVRSLSLKVADGVASGEVPADGAAELHLQAVPDGGAGGDGATRVRAVSLASAKAPAPAEDGSNAAAQPPAGWKEYRPKDQAFAVWIPARARAQRESERTLTARGQPMKSNTVTVDTGSLLYTAQQIVVGKEFVQTSRAELEELIRDLLTGEARGRVASEREITVGTIPGKEYRIESPRGVIRARVLVAGNWILLMQASGSKDVVDSEGVRTFFSSCRISPEPRAVAPATPPPLGGDVPPSSPAPPRPSGPVAEERKTKIQGGGGDPEFADETPNALLVGADVAIGKFFDNDVSHAVRPIFRLGDRDVEGAWHGPTQGRRIVRVVARPGYAVGAVTVKNGLTVDGFSLTFMKVTDGRLDPLDSYESQWLGGPGGGGPVKIGGDGTQVAGMIGKAKGDALTGLGLLYIDAVPPPPAPVTPTLPPVTNTPIPPQPATTTSRPAPTVVPPVVQPAQPRATQEPGAPEPKRNTALVIGAVVGSVVVVLGIVGTVLVLSQQKGGRNRRRFDDDDDDDDDDDRYRRRRRRRRD